MASVLQDLAKALTPPPPYTSPEYDGLEFRWNMFVFRPALFKVEAILIGGMVLYFVWFFIGKSINKSKAEAWMKANFPVLDSQFSKPVSASNSGLICDGYADYFNFSTGRKNVASLHSVLTLNVRQDIALMLYRFVWGMIDLTSNYEDELELDFKLGNNAGATGFVWGVVAKDCLAKAKKFRWDLTLTRTSENATLGNNNFCVMTEYADVSEQIFKNTKIAAAINEPAIAPYLKSLTITDQPRDRPESPIPSEHRSRHLIVSLRLPPASDASVTGPLIKACLALIDALESPGRITFKPETRTKLRKTREEIDETIRKEAEAEKREEAEEEKARERKRREDERLSKLSAAEQKKELEKGRKRALRKAQGRTVKK